jgi:hypothetical protein
MIFARTRATLSEKPINPNGEEDNPLNLIIYSKKTDSEENEIQFVFKSLFSKNEIEIFHSIEDLRQRILRTTYDEGIVVLIAERREDFSELLPVIHHFRRLRIILVLPDRKPETIKIGYQLEPRFLSFVDKGFSEVKAVLKKMTAANPTVKNAL